MDLLPPDVLKAFADQGYVGDMEPKDIKIIAKYFNPCGPGNWYAAEYDPENRRFFGFVSIFNDPACDELGYFSLDELQSLRCPPLGLPIERDLYFGEHTLQEVIDGARP